MPKLGVAGVQSPWDRGMTYSLKQSASLYVLPCEIWLFCVKGLHINWRNPPKLGTANPLKTPLMCTTLPNFVISGQMVWAYWRKSTLKYDTHIPPFKVTQVLRTDTDRLATYDILLMFSSKRGPVSYRFQDCSRKLQTFHPHVCNALLRWFSLVLVYRIGSRK